MNEKASVAASVTSNAAPSVLSVPAPVAGPLNPLLKNWSDERAVIAELAAALRLCQRAILGQRTTGEAMVAADKALAKVQP